MFLGVLDYGLLLTTVVPIKMFDDLQTIQNHALRSVLNVYDPHDLHVIQLHDTVGVRFLKHRMFIQLMMCIRNAYINQSLPVIQRDMVTRGNDGATFSLPVPRIKSISVPSIWDHKSGTTCHLTFVQQTLRNSIKTLQ